jgi:lysozyme
MAKTTVRKPNIRKKAIKKKKSFFSTKSAILFLFSISISIGLYHYRNAILYYFSFKSDKVIKEDKVAQARIYQILKAHDHLTFGLDVSQYQGKINWEVIDSQFKTNWKAAKHQKLLRGAYHYYRPNENSLEQAEKFIQTVQLKKGDLPPVLDIEQLPKNQSMANLKKGLQRWLDKVETHYKVKPIIYTGEKYYENFLKDEFEGYTFWIANYNFFVEEIKEDWLFWQFTEKANIAGIEEKVDLNIYNGTPKMLEYLTIN